MRSRLLKFVLMAGLMLAILGMAPHSTLAAAAATAVDPAPALGQKLTESAPKMAKPAPTQPPMMQPAAAESSLQQQAAAQSNPMKPSLMKPVSVPTATPTAAPTAAPTVKAAPAAVAKPAETGYPEALARSLMGECLASNNPIKQTIAQDPAVLKNIAAPKLALTRTIVEQAVTRLDREAKNAEVKLAEQVQGRQNDLQALIKDPARFDKELAELDTAISSNQVPSDQLPELKRLQTDLKALRANPNSLAKKVKESQEQALRQLRDQQKRQEQQIRLCATAVDQLQARYSVAQVTDWYASLLKSK
jgi:hypothetical protein